MRYVVYLRVSTEQQTDGLGLDVQEDACRAWLRSGRHRLVEVCTDVGSGSDDVASRAGLTRALAHLYGDRADGIVVYRLDRLARDLVLQEQVLAELHRLGKRLASCSPTEDANLEADPDDPQRALVRRMLGVIAQYERDLIRLRLRSGRVRKALDGGYAGGPPPFGWRASGGELVPVEDEQAAIRRFVAWRRNDMSYRQIAEHAAAAGIKSRAPSGLWRPATVAAVIERARPRKEAAKV